jgi:hypothetical protein
MYPLICRNGASRCGVLGFVKSQDSTMLIRKVLISLTLQRRDYFIRQLTILRGESSCAVSGRLINLHV